MKGVSIIIPTYNGKKLLEENLPFVAEECARYEGETEILIVDDASRDGTAEFIAACFPGIQLLRNEKNSGFSRSANAGILKAKHPLIFLLNNDVKITPGVLAGLAGGFAENDVFAVQAKIVSNIGEESKDYPGYFSSKYGLFKYEYRPVTLLPGSMAEMDFASGGASMYSRAKFLALGLFDERFSPFYFEDIDISFRARWFGWRILYQPAAKVYHLHLGSTVKANYPAFKYNLIHKKNYFLFLLKNTVKVHTLPALFAYALYRTCKGGFTELAGFFCTVTEYLSFSRKQPAVRDSSVLYLDAPLFWPGGGQISLLNILRNLTEYTPFVVLDGQSGIEKDLRAIGIPYRVIKAGKTDIFGLIPAVIRILNLVKPKLVHCNAGTTFFSFVFALAAKMRGIPFVWHNRVLETAGLKEKLIARLASRVIVVSDEVGKKFKWLPQEKVIKLYNAVDLERFKPLANVEYLYKEFNLDKRAQVIGVFSRLDKWKGHGLFLAAAKKIVSKRPGCMLLMVGAGEERGKVEALAHELGLSGKILFTGHREDIAALMNLCAVIVNPSIMPEAFGRTIIEGMACGKPVVATAIGGPMEIIETGVDGFLVPLDAEALASAVLGILDDPATAGKIGVNARKKTELRFDIKAQMCGLHRIYEAL